MTAFVRPLTGLRFLAAAMVVLFHLDTLSTALAAAPEPLQKMSTYGSSSVGLFFILSGFILSYSYLGGTRPLDRRSFWVARFSRIYPVYILGLALAAPLTFHNPLAQGPRGIARLALTALSAPTLTQAWFPTTAVVWNPPGWSLSAEAFFYLSFPFAAPFLMRASARTASVLLVVAWAACLLPPLIHGAIFPDLLSVNAEPWTRVVKFNPLLRFPEFAAGILIARMFLIRQADRTVAPRMPLQQFHALAILASLLAIWLLSPPIPFLLSNNGIFDPLFGALIYALASGGGVLGRALSVKPAVLLGEASYALYVLHEPILQWISHLQDMGVVASDLFEQRWFIPGYVAFTLGLSLVVFLLLEQPSRSRLREAFSRKAVRLNGPGEVPDIRLRTGVFGLANAIRTAGRSRPDRGS